MRTGRFFAKSVAVHEYAGVNRPQLATSIVKLAMPSSPYDHQEDDGAAAGHAAP